MPKRTAKELLLQGPSDPNKLRITIELEFEQPLTEKDRVQVSENLLGRLSEWAGMGGLTPDDPLDNDNALETWDSWTD
jgi:hypothetical protein